MHSGKIYTIYAKGFLRFETNISMGWGSEFIYGKKTLAWVLVIVGFFLILNSVSFSMTGNVVSDSEYFNSGSVLALIFMTIGICFFLSDVGHLEETLIQHEVDTEPQPMDFPFIIDTNYLYKKCENIKDFREFKKTIDSFYQRGNPAYIPEEIMKEFKTSVGTEAEVARKRNLKDILGSKACIFEDEKDMSPENVDKYKTEAEELIKETPKYFAFRYLSRLHKGENLDMDRFIRNRHPKSPFREREIGVAIADAVSKYNMCKNRKNQLKVIHDYSLAKGDVDLLRNALFLIDNPNRYGDTDLDRVTIASDDKHLTQAVKVYKALNPHSRHKLNVLS
jgi:hypothetical protein